MLHCRSSLFDGVPDSSCHLETDPDPNFYFDADPDLDPDPSYQMKAQKLKKSSVADPDPGSGPFLTPGSGIRDRLFPDPGSQIHNFESLTIFWVKSSIDSLKIGPNFFLQHIKTKIMCNFVKFVAT
jgi:hypothetical protein